MNIDFPYHFDNRGATAATDDEDHVRDMIEQLLFTSPGERVNRPSLGSGLLQLVFSPNSPELASALQYTMQASLNQWLGDVIEVQTLDVSSGDSAVTIDLKYLLRRTQESRTASFSRSISI